ncbi:Hexokinase [Wickerhamomyces ciferrii]|uniref:Phosphotransferase n=1 Tax=Wickerhamomyces ciferrii (strain ATCC 14091 / BCRC 22168 / CBS 111 / JCM 3599 / NBRC 0793 / NRRL Y-1031 F-60-10) TaxID=1206466 RepID=K0KCK8_WICCF|nr:Hexokinase [Wickerhamomyces ciferrii]CCH42795.1 Hexokinase [Wickerhamomyces ciferrii]
MVSLVEQAAINRTNLLKGVSPEILSEIEKIEEILTVSPETLKKITAHFITELEKGLSKEGGNIPMIPGWVLEYPTGEETGDYLAIDLGGTNLRVVLVKLLGGSKFETEQHKYSLPDNIRTAKAEELWSFIADSLKVFVDQHFPSGTSKKLPLGFTFSYPASQNAINEGILQRWTKGYDIDGVEGKDVVPMLQDALASRNVPIEVVALINDTTGTLVASAYTDPEAKMGLIFGTGCNGAYYEVAKNIPKLEGKYAEDIDPNGLMAINCEYGAFDNEHKVLPRTKYDLQVDEESPRPGQQSFEKMISGYYLGELLRLILLDLYHDQHIFKGADVSLLSKPFIFDTSVPAKIEEDASYEELKDTEALFKEILGVETNLNERKLIRRLAELIGNRASRLSVCGIAAICKKRGYETAHCAADGSVYNRYPGFKERAAQGLRDIFDWDLEPKDYPIIIVPAQDGSGAGAAIIAALTEKRLAAGKSVGIKQ